MTHNIPRFFVNYLIIGFLLVVGIAISSCSKDVTCPAHGGAGAPAEVHGDDEDKGKGLGDRSRKRDKNGLIKKKNPK